MFKRIIMTAGSAVRANWKRILYYAGVATVLCAVAACAQAYRTKPQSAEPADVAVLPPESVAKEMPVRFAMPEGASVLRAYAEKPVWNAKLSMYETHGGTDLAFADDLVRSVSDGTVTFVDSGSILVEAGTYTIAYRSVEPDSSLKTGASVRAGDSLGKASNSDPAEAWLQKHAHVEVTETGGKVDPERLLVKNMS